MSKVVVTGACGFIGSRLAHRLLERGEEVFGIDNLSRRGSEHNAGRLGEAGMRLLRADLSSPQAADEALAEIGSADAVFHLSAQVAVTRSYQDPGLDFRDNAAATFNVIDGIRRRMPGAYCLYASTNKVYGHLAVDRPVGMGQPMLPYTPYGVSKAVGELYFTEYGRPEFGLTTCSLRQSCIYGPNQFGVEDQGWVAWFSAANLLGLEITIYGDGRQTRDLLFVEDLVDLYLLLWERRLTGVYPVGGGADNVLSVAQGIQRISEITGRPFASVRHEAERPGDQHYFVADLSWVKELDLPWSPKVGTEQGLRAMIQWQRDHLEEIRAAIPA